MRANGSLQEVEQRMNMESHSIPSKIFFDATQRNHYIFLLRNVFILASNNYNVVHEMVHYIIFGGGEAV